MYVYVYNIFICMYVYVLYKFIGLEYSLEKVRSIDISERFFFWELYIYKLFFKMISKHVEEMCFLRECSDQQ